MVRVGVMVRRRGRSILMPIIPILSAKLLGERTVRFASLVRVIAVIVDLDDGRVKVRLV